MLKDLFYDNDGKLKSVGPDYESEEALWHLIVECFCCMDGRPAKQDDEEKKGKNDGNNACLDEHCSDCPYGDETGDAFITRLNRWINFSVAARDEVKKVFQGKTDKELGEYLKKRNNTLPPREGIARPTISAWIDKGQDPSKRANDKASRDNIYKLSSLLGLFSRNTIKEFFTSVFNADAFTRFTVLECCIEHFAGIEGWLERSLEAAEFVTDPNAYAANKNADEEEDVLSAASVIRNRKLKESEFKKALASTNHMKVDVEKTRGRIVKLSWLVWLMLNAEEECELPEGWSPKNKKLITPIFCGGARDNYALDKKAHEAAMKELRSFGAGRNFPTPKILNAICDGEANEEKIRRMFILLIFAATFLKPSKYLDRDFLEVYQDPIALSSAVRDRTPELIADFLDDCDCLLERSRLRRLDVNDGFDALIIYCCLTKDPMGSLRRRLGYFKKVNNEVSV